MNRISKEAFYALKEIIENEKVPEYWANRFENLSAREDSILRGCFKELSESGMISAKWADNYPYFIQVLKDGYLYEEYMKEEKLSAMSQFERELSNLLDRAGSIKNPINTAPIGTDVAEYNRPSEDWVNDAEIFFNKFLKNHSLADRMKRLLFHRSLDCFSQLASCFQSVANDRDFINEMNGIEKRLVPAYQAKTLLQYDVFLSHANADKEQFVDELNSSLDSVYTC